MVQHPTADVSNNPSLCITVKVKAFIVTITGQDYSLYICHFLVWLGMQGQDTCHAMLCAGNIVGTGWKAIGKRTGGTQFSMRKTTIDASTGRHDLANGG